VPDGEEVVEDGGGASPYGINEGKRLKLNQAFRLCLKTIRTVCIPSHQFIIQSPAKTLIPANVATCITGTGLALLVQATVACLTMSEESEIRSLVRAFPCSR
jgi:hypothetical protein